MKKSGCPVDARLLFTIRPLHDVPRFEQEIDAPVHRPHSAVEQGGMRVGGACHKGRDGVGIAGRRIAGVSLRVLDLAVCELILLEEAHLPPHDFEVIVAGKAGRLEALYLRLLCEEPVELWREGAPAPSKDGACAAGGRKVSWPLGGLVSAPASSIPDARSSVPPTPCRD